MSNEKQIRGILINPETGEKLLEVYEGDRILRNETIEANREKQKREKDIIPWDAQPFYKGFIQELKAIIPKLNMPEKVFLFSIMPYISYEDCCIKDRKGNDIGTEELKEICGISRSLVYETINTLIEKDIIYRGKNSKNRQYFVNPWLFCKGKQINKVLQTMFKNYYINMYGMTWKEYVKKDSKKINRNEDQFLEE